MSVVLLSYDQVGSVASYRGIGVSPWEVDMRETGKVEVNWRCFLTIIYP